MPQVNLSTLTGQELRRLLDASRGRGDAALSYKVLQEMAARREGNVARTPFMSRRSGEPHFTDVDLDDPLADEDGDLPPLPAWRLPARQPEAVAASPPEPEAPSAPARSRSRRKASAEAAPVAAANDEPPPPPLDAVRPLSRWGDAEPPEEEAADNQDWSLRMPPAEPQSPRPPRQTSFRGVTVFALGLLLGAALGWWGARIDRDVLSPAKPAAAPIQTAALTPPATPVPEPSAPAAPIPGAAASSPAEPGPETSPGPAAGPPPPEPGAPAPDSSSSSSSSSPSPQPSQSAPIPSDAEVAAAETAPAVATGCAAQPTPADREICGDPHLRKLQHELQRAYAQALDAHQDRTLLRQRQLAWRDARNTVTDPDRLAQLYEQRIHKLNAATEAARQQR
jgi:uncharacterized protein YecT (DUF1311 family)